MLGVEIHFEKIIVAIAAFMAIEAVPLIISVVIALALFEHIISALYSLVRR